MRREVGLVVLCLLGLALSIGCSALAAQPTTRVTPATAQSVRATPSALSTVLASGTRRPSPSPSVLSRVTRSPGPSSTPTVAITLDPDAELARRHVLALDDLPPGFTLERSRVVTNADAAGLEAEPATVLADYEKWGRVTGFEAAYSRGGLAALSGLMAIESVASVYASSAGAHESLEDFRARAFEDGAAPVSMPNLADESLAVRLGQVTTQGSGRTNWSVYAIRIRKGNLLLSVNGYGLASTLSFDEVLEPAKKALAQPRQYLPEVRATSTPTAAPPAGSAPVATPTPGQARLVVKSYRAYRSGVGNAVFVVGEAENLGDGVATRVQVAVSLLDGQGKVLAAGSISSVRLAQVPPGGRYPFNVMIDRVSKDWTEVLVQLQSHPPSGGEISPYPDLRAEGVSLVIPSGSDVGYGLAGAVANIGAKVARSVKVIGVAYDGQGRVLDVAGTTAKLERIEPGTTAPFDLIWIGVKTDPPFRYELFVEGQVS